jgi:imidazolonepropionase-like amidohydrolase
LFDGKINSGLQEEITILLGIEDKTGTVEADKSADFLVLDENPLEDLMVLENLRYVVMRGNVIEKPAYAKLNVLE